MDVCTINYVDNINNFIRDHNHCEQDIDLKLELCPNFKACNQFLKKIHKDCYNGRCLDCDITFRKNLEFVNENNKKNFNFNFSIVSYYRKISSPIWYRL